MEDCVKCLPGKFTQQLYSMYPPNPNLRIRNVGFNYNKHSKTRESKIYITNTVSVKNKGIPGRPLNDN